MILKGNPVSPGVIVGKALIYKPSAVSVSEEYFEKGREEEYIGLYHSAFSSAHRELEHLVSSFSAKDSDKAKIFSAHIEILDDEEINEMIHDAIVTEHKLPDYAVSCAYDEFIQLIGKAKDPLIAARAADFYDVKNRLLRILQGKKENSLSGLPENTVIVAHDLLPSETAALDRVHVAAIITEAGGSTSHTAIIARNYQIPAVVGVARAMAMIGNGVLLAVDAETGEITVAPDGKELDENRAKAEAFRNNRELSEKYINKPATTADGQHLDIGINIGSDKFDIPSLNYDYIGLFRTEFLYMESDHLPGEEEQFEAYKRVLKNADGKAVTLRTLDIGGDKTLNYMQLPKEENPFLGKRALRFCLDNPEIFNSQLRAALRASAFGPLQIMFPMVGSISDIRRAKAAVSAAKDELRAEKKAFNENIKLGIMIEIPSIAAVADLAAEEVDFASVGTNDLTQYLCAADRMNPEVSDYYQSLSPAVLRTLGYIFDQFNAKGKPVSVCGELAGNLAAALILVGLGLKKLSMSQSNIASVKAALAGITMEKAHKMAAVCKHFATEDEVKAYLKLNI